MVILIAFFVVLTVAMIALPVVLLMATNKESRKLQEKLREEGRESYLLMGPWGSIHVIEYDK